MSANKLQRFDYAFIPKQLEWIDLHQVIIIIIIIIVTLIIIIMSSKLNWSITSYVLCV